MDRNDGTTGQARWRAVFESAVDGIIVIDERGRIQAINPAGERLFGYDAQDVVGRNVSMLMPSPYQEEHDAYIQHYLGTGERKIIGIGREVTGLKHDGTTFPLHLSVGEIKLEGERGFTGILHDLSARVRSERHLREQEALAKIGEMAAVLAHEVKNPLTAVSGAIQIIGDALPPDGQEAGIIQEILKRLETLNELTNDLLLFARPPRPTLAPVDLDGLLRMTADLFSVDPAHAGVRLAISGTAPDVSGDAELLKIVFQNLLINAAHAMNRVGTVYVNLATAPGRAQVEIVDAGPGIPPELRPRLFQPFFTTKSRGTGLGLSTAKRLLEAQHGTIQLSWPETGGTTVTMTIPALAEEG